MKRLALRSLNEFRCLAADCPAHCCGRWNIQVDSDTRARWTRDAPELLESIVTINERGRDYSVLAKNEAGNCCHLNQGGLCNVHAERGEDSLPLMCRQYPRLQLSTPASEIQTAELSCPAIAKQVITSTRSRSLFATAGAIPPPGTLDPVFIIGEVLAELTAEVLALDSVPLRVGLYHIARILRELARLSESGQLDMDTLKRHCHGTRAALHDTSQEYRQGLLQPESSADRYWQWVLELDGAADFVKPDEVLQLAVSAGVQPDAGPAEAIACIRELAYGRAGERLDVMLRNFLEVSLVNRGFPRNPVAGNHLAAFLDGVAPLSALALRAWVDIVRSGNLLPDRVVVATYEVERSFKHRAVVRNALEINHTFVTDSFDPLQFLAAC